MKKPVVRRLSRVVMVALFDSIAMPAATILAQSYSVGRYTIA
jgi:hypothetical protein